MTQPIAPLELLYPQRCYDCSQPIGDFGVGVLCGRCQAMYDREKERRRAQ